jgi:hypothetical protein
MDVSPAVRTPNLCPVVAGGTICWRSYDCQYKWLILSDNIIGHIVDNMSEIRQSWRQFIVMNVKIPE